MFACRDLIFHEDEDKFGRQLNKEEKLGVITALRGNNTLLKVPLPKGCFSEEEEQLVDL